MSTPALRDIPALGKSRATLGERQRFDLSDYGFVVDARLAGDFEIVPIEMNDQEAFLFFYLRKDLAVGRFSLFNLHAFLKYTGSIADFAHSRGQSVRDISLDEMEVLGRPGLGYRRNILMKDLFVGAEQVISFIGGSPDLLVVDSHLYFMHHHHHYYSGMIHEPGDDDAYAALRAALFKAIYLV